MWVKKRAERLELPPQKSPAVSAYFGVWVKPNFESLLDKTKTPQTAVLRGFCGAAIQIRTGDLILTKDALYRLSHSSTRVRSAVLHELCRSLRFAL